MKIYVEVLAKFSADGELMPVDIIWEDGRKYHVDRVLRVERCASRKAGGAGIMYTCMVEGKRSHLFYEVDKWFVDKKE